MSTPNGERDLASKAFGALEIKDAAKGEAEAVIATLNTVDRDREVILPGAIKDGAKVKLSMYGHGAMFGDMPVGKGTLHVEGDKVLARLKYFISTARGRDAFDTLKELGPDQEWSFGFRILDAENADEEWRKQGAERVLKKLEPFEVSPVLIGAGVGTRTVSAKEDPAIQAAKDAEAKAAEDAKAEEAARIRAAIEAEVAANKAAADEFDKFRRTQRRLGVG